MGPGAGSMACSVLWETSSGEGKPMLQETGGEIARAVILF